MILYFLGTPPAVQRDGDHQKLRADLQALGRDLAESPEHSETAGAPGQIVIISDRARGMGFTGVPNGRDCGNSLTTAGYKDVDATVPYLISWVIYPDASEPWVRAHYDMIRNLMEAG